MTIFFTSDLHLHHKNILDFEPRPFETVEEMNEGLVKAWNDVVRKTDTIYHLGDFCFGNVKEWLDVLNRLHGNVILIKGNHDTGKMLRRVLRDGYVSEIHELGTLIKEDGLTLNLSHYPMMIGERLNNFSIHGHLHGTTTQYLNHVNVGIDSNFAKSLGKPFGTPIELDELLAHLHSLNKLIEEMKR